jgi:hypothetical protein
LGLKWGAVDFINNSLSIEHAVVPGTRILHIKDITKTDSSNAALPLQSKIIERLAGVETATGSQQAITAE